MAERRGKSVPFRNVTARPRMLTWDLRGCVRMLLRFTAHGRECVLSVAKIIATHHTTCQLAPLEACGPIALGNIHAPLFQASSNPGKLWQSKSAGSQSTCCAREGGVHVSSLCLRCAPVQTKEHCYCVFRHRVRRIPATCAATVIWGPLTLHGKLHATLLSGISFIE